MRVLVVSKSLCGYVSKQEQYFPWIKYIYDIYLSIIIIIYIYIYIYIYMYMSQWRYSYYNGYSDLILNRKKVFIFHKALIPLRKVEIQLYSL